MIESTSAEVLEDEREATRSRYILSAIVFIVGVLVAFGVGFLISESQKEAAKSATTAAKAVGTAEQAQAEKFNLAQQVALACAEEKGLDEASQRKLCRDAEQVVQQGPRGPQGIPGTQGPQGIPGEDGRDGTNGKNGIDGSNGINGQDGVDGQPGENGQDGAQGPPGPAGKDGKDGAIGPQGPAGKDGEPPFSWVVYDEAGNVTETCTRSADFDPASPTYTCTESASSGSVTAGG